MSWWEPGFVGYWCLTVKYINPAILYFILVGLLKQDIETMYGDYSTGWQVCGWIIPSIGIILLFVSLLWQKSDIELDYDEFILYDEDESDSTI